MVQLLNQTKFALRRRIKGFEVPDKPQFDSAALSYFVTRLAQARIFLEYGAGGSTVEAVRQGKRFVSVESDPFYLRAVQKKIGRFPKATLLHANIGLTGPWGVPLIKWKTKSRLQRWACYASLPWLHLEAPPDLILIDGRFRIHSTLFTINKLKDQQFELLFDDYYDRRHHFQIIEHFALLREMRGRMAIFEPKAFSQSHIEMAIEQSISDFE